jgi:hypothetical protein
MVDEMRYNDKGNEVTLIKRFASAPAAPEGGEPPGAGSPEGWDESR